jgi:5-methylcytosine-specific restriction endonuclease McrA
MFVFGGSVGNNPTTRRYEMTNRKRNNNVANNGGAWIAPKKRRAIYMRDDLRCVYCRAGIEDDIQFTLDHIVPQELGGDNSAQNLTTACKHCNTSKGSKSQRQFFTYLRDKGVDTDKIAKRIRRNIRRKLQGVKCMVRR